MGRTGDKNKEDKRKASAGTSSERPARLGIAPGYDFTQWTPPEGYEPPRKEVLTDAAKKMTKEVHPWFDWPKAPKSEKIRLQNKLALLQHKQLTPPRLMDSKMLGDLKIQRDFDEMFVTKVEYENGWFDVPMWQRIFRLHEPVVREWCLEFYSSLWLDAELKESELSTQKCIHFRCGGIQRHCTLAEFGYLTGMFTRNELAHPGLATFIRKARLETSGLEGSLNDFWTEISGEQVHQSNQSKVAVMYSPLLRVLHKFISYNFHQRSNQNDKVYSDDLWLMRLFVQGSPTTYACAPYLLAAYMDKHHDVAICCGHFITHIVKTLGCDRAERPYCSMQVEMKLISWKDLMQSKLLKGQTHTLIDARVPTIEGADDDEMDEQRAAASEVDPYSFEGLARKLEQVVETQNELLQQQYLVQSQIGRVMFTQDYYHPYMERLVRRETESLQQELPRYAPPALFMPRQTYGGFYYPPRSFDEGGVGSSDLPTHFGTYHTGSGVGGLGVSGVSSSGIDDVQCEGLSSEMRRKDGVGTQ